MYFLLFNNLDVKESTIEKDKRLHKVFFSLNDKKNAYIFPIAANFWNSVFVAKRPLFINCFKIN